MAHSVEIMKNAGSRADRWKRVDSFHKRAVDGLFSVSKVLHGNQSQT
jgi:hypothetical protein